MHEITKLGTTANRVDADEGNIPNIDGVFILVLDCQLHSIPRTVLVYTFFKISQIDETTPLEGNYHSTCYIVYS